MLYMLLKLLILFYYLFSLVYLFFFFLHWNYIKTQALHTETSAKTNKILKNSCMKITIKFIHE